jgi:hypothetical protein
MLLHGKTGNRGESPEYDPERNGVFIDLQVDAVKKEGTAVQVTVGGCRIGGIQMGFTVGGVAVKLGTGGGIRTAACCFNADPIRIAGKKGRDDVIVF